MAKAAYDFPADSSFEQAARRVLSTAFRKMMDNAAGTRAGLKRSVATPEDIEALHDMRVGSRRLRAALSVFARALPRAEYNALDREIGRITDALGRVRDLDVQLDSLRALQASLPPNEAYGIGRLVERQTGKRDVERKALLTELDHLKKMRFERRFQKVLDRSLPDVAPKKAEGK